MLDVTETSRRVRFSVFRMPAPASPEFNPKMPGAVLPLRIVTPLISTSMRELPTPSSIRKTRLRPLPLTATKSAPSPSITTESVISNWFVPVTLSVIVSPPSKTLGWKVIVCEPRVSLANAIASRSVLMSSLSANVPVLVSSVVSTCRRSWISIV